jgi:hypothetical protein
MAAANNVSYVMAGEVVNTKVCESHQCHLCLIGRSSEICRFVRHPGYAGNILALPGMVLALSSVRTIIPVIVALVIAGVPRLCAPRALPVVSRYLLRNTFP